MVKLDWNSNAWYEQDKFNAHSVAFNTVTAIENDQVRYYEQYKIYASLYKDQQIVGFTPGEYRRSQEDLGSEQISYNVIRSCVDSLLSKIAMNHPAPKFLTNNGSEDFQESAKQMEKFVNGVMLEQKVQDKTVKQFRDSLIYGIGFIKIFGMDDDIKIENIHPSRMVWDNNAALDCEPNELFQKTYMDKSKLIALFPKNKNDIESAKVKTINSSLSIVRELVEVWECWRKGTTENPGRHIIFSENTTFFDEPYTKDSFPFSVMRYSDDVMGWFGIGLAEQLDGIQFEVNSVLYKIQRNMKLLSVPYLIKEKGSNVADEHLLNNDEARLVEYTGTKPEVVTPPAVNQQVFQYLEQLYQRAFEIAGISQLSATSQKPSGLNSGVALRTFNDIETQRFSIVARRWENLFIDIAKNIIRTAQGLMNEDEGYEVRFVGNNIVEKVNFKDVDLDESKYVLQVYPASSLPNTPAGKLQSVIELVQSQMIDPKEGRALLDFADLEKSNRLATASIDDLEAMFEHFLSKGKYIAPLPFQDLPMGIKLGVSYYLRAKMDGVKESRLDLVLRWIEEASDMLSPPKPPVEPAPLPVAQLENVPIPGAMPPSMMPVEPIEPPPLDSELPIEPV